MTKLEIMRIEQRAAEWAAGETACAREAGPWEMMLGDELVGWIANREDDDPETEAEWVGWLACEIGLVDEEEMP